MEREGDSGKGRAGPRASVGGSTAPSAPCGQRLHFHNLLEGRESPPPVSIQQRERREGGQFLVRLPCQPPVAAKQIATDSVAEHRHSLTVPKGRSPASRYQQDGILFSGPRRTLPASFGPCWLRAWRGLGLPCASSAAFSPPCPASPLSLSTLAIRFTAQLGHQHGSLISGPLITSAKTASHRGHTRRWVRTPRTVSEALLVPPRSALEPP